MVRDLRADRSCTSHKRSVYYIGTAAIVSCMISAPPALAQEVGPEIDSAPASTSAEVGEIVVTAQFREQNLQDTPLAITAVTAEMLEERSQTDISDVAAQAPNVTLQEAPPSYGPVVQAFIRGVGQSDSNFALEPGVGLYIDDVYYATMQGSILQLLDVDRVEILRGPQGTLAGQNSIGGAVKLYSKKPRGNDGGFVQATYGSFERTEIRGAAEFTLVPDKLFARVSGVGAQRDGYVTLYDYACTHPGAPIRSVQTGNSCKLGTAGGKSFVATRGAARWVPTDRMEVNLVADFTKDNSEIAPSVLIYVGTPTGPGLAPTDNPAAFTIDGVPLGTSTGSAFISYSPFGDFAQDTFSNSPYVSYENFMNSAPRDGTAPYSVPRVTQMDSWGFSGHVDIDLSDTLSLDSITAYRATDGAYSSADGSPVNTALTTNRDRHWQFSQELRLNGNIADIIAFTVGGFYLKSESRYTSRVSLPALEFVGGAFSPRETKALFANADVRLTDALNLNLGIRYSDIEKEYVYERSGTPGSIYGGNAPPNLAPLDGLVGRFAGDRFDYRAALQYRWAPELMTYAQYSTGFKGGGINPRAFFPAQALSHDPETLDAFEVGLKSDLFDRRLRLNAAAFLNKYKNILMTVNNCPLPGAPPAPCALPINAGTADVKGFEVEAFARLLGGLTVDASLAYLDFDYKSILPAALAAGITLDMDSPFVQEWQYSVGIQYEALLGEHGSLTPRLDLSYQSDYFSAPINLAPFNVVPSRTLLNGRITYRTDDQDWQVALEVTNITDEIYFDGIFDNRGSTRAVNARPGRPREWALSVTRRF